MTHKTNYIQMRKEKEQGDRQNKVFIGMRKGENTDACAQNYSLEKKFEWKPSFIFPSETLIRTVYSFFPVYYFYTIVIVLARSAAYCSICESRQQFICCLTYKCRWIKCPVKPKTCFLSWESTQFPRFLLCAGLFVFLSGDSKEDEISPFVNRFFGPDPMFGVYRTVRTVYRKRLHLKLEEGLLGMML